MEQFIERHRPQLEGSGVPQHYWPVLHEKLVNQQFDAGTAFQLLRVEYDEDEEVGKPYALGAIKPLTLDDSNTIYLIDHAWTFRLDMSKKQLLSVPGLLDRMCGIMGVEAEVNEVKIEKVLTTMWQYVQTYSVNAQGLAVENRMPIWYIVDEVGSAIHHSDTPNCRTVPFMYIDEQTTYSLMFPIKEIEEGDLITRDYAEGVTDTKNRDAFLLPWKYTDFTSHTFEQTEPPFQYFLHGRIEETLPEPDTQPPQVDANRPLRVFAEYKLIKENLTDPAFEIVEDEDYADILWYTKHFKGYKELSQTMPNKFINQFPFENVLTIKDLLCIVARRTCKNTHFNPDTLDSYPKWLPTTFNLRSEVTEFASYYQHRAQKGLDNHWIIKPFNLARGLDTHITPSIAQIMRHAETGPKIAQKYIENPVCFYRPEINGKVKFDIRYVVLLKSADTNPELYMYNNFFLRFANHQYELNDFDEYEKHFTVMNYHANANLRHMMCNEFLEQWEKQYPDVAWKDIEDQIAEAFKELFTAAVSKAPPCGIGKSPQSRAVYAADIMLAWENNKMQIKVLEMNWTPDCQRACQYYPNFYNDIFKLLFLNEYNDAVFRRVA